MYYRFTVNIIENNLLKWQNKHDNIVSFSSIQLKIEKQNKTQQTSNLSRLMYLQDFKVCKLITLPFKVHIPQNMT